MFSQLSPAPGELQFSPSDTSPLPVPVLDQTPSDPKALFRRCQALEALGRVQEAYRDARHLHNEQPDNREVQPLLTRLYAAVQKQVCVPRLHGTLVTLGGLLVWDGFILIACIQYIAMFLFSLSAEAR